MTDLELPPEEYVVVAGGILDALGLRPANDIDLVVSEALFEHLQGMGDWQEGRHPDLDIPMLTHGPVEAFLTWDEPDFRPNLPALKEREQVIEGIPYAGLRRVREWKVRKGRDKDKTDVALIDGYWDSQA
ncbi:MAG TPA: hypothetical protein VIF43_01875 [Patescibacteria group bacterium]